MICCASMSLFPLLSRPCAKGGLCAALGMCISDTGHSPVMEQWPRAHPLKSPRGPSDRSILRKQSSGPEKREPLTYIFVLPNMASIWWLKTREC